MVCRGQTAAVCPETTGNTSVEEQQTTHHTHACWYFYEVTLVIFNNPCRHRKMMCCGNIKNPLLLLAWISWEMFLLVMKNQNPNIHAPQWVEVGCTTPLYPIAQAKKSLNLIAKAYSHTPSHMRLGSLPGKCEQPCGGTQCTAKPSVFWLRISTYML